MDPLFVGLLLLLVGILAFAAGAHTFKRVVDRGLRVEVPVTRKGLSPLKTRARVTETQEELRLARAAREEAHKAWSDVGKPS